MKRSDGSRFVLVLLLVATLIWGRLFFRLWQEPKAAPPKHVSPADPHTLVFTIAKPLVKQPATPMLWEPFRQLDLRPKAAPTLPSEAVAQAAPAPPFPWRYVGSLRTERDVVYLFLEGDELSYLSPGIAMGPWQLCETEAEAFVFKAPPNHTKRVPR